MRFTRLRLTVGRLMIGVAIVALLISGVQAWRWSRLARVYQAYARNFAGLETVARTTAQIHEENKARYAERPGVVQSMDDAKWSALRNAEHFARLKDKYRDATSRPWLTVPPDPPPPPP